MTTALAEGVAAAIVNVYRTTNITGTACFEYD